MSPRASLPGPIGIITVAGALRRALPVAFLAGLAATGQTLVLTVSEESPALATLSPLSAWLPAFGASLLLVTTPLRALSLRGHPGNCWVWAKDVSVLFALAGLMLLAVAVTGRLGLATGSFGSLMLAVAGMMLVLGLGAAAMRPVPGNPTPEDAADVFG